MAYEVIFRDDARKAFARLDRAMQKRIGKSLDRLADDDKLIILVLGISYRSTAY